jgi:hypothetical protein
VPLYGRAHRLVTYAGLVQVAGRSVHRRAVLLVIGGAALIAIVAWGASKVGQGGKSELVVIFKNTPTAEQVAAVRAGCPSSPGAVLEPADRNQLATSRRYPIRYDVSKASTDQKAAVYRCLSHFPNMSVSEETTGDS